MNTNLFQKSIADAHAFHRLVKKTDLGKTKFESWTSLSSAVLSNAYAVWADTHDNAGRAIKVVDESTAKEHRAALFASLHAVAEMVGEVAFSDENAVLLTVDDDFAALVDSICTQRGAIVNDAVKAIEDRIIDAKEDRAAAKAHFDRYNFNGVSEDAFEEAQAKLAAAELVLENLYEERKTEVAKKNAKTYALVPKDEKKFRMDFETVLFELITNQRSMSYEDYCEKRRAANKAKRERRKAAKEAAAKKYGNT